MSDGTLHGQVKLSDCVVSGGKDGSLKVVDAATGRVIQSQDLVHWAPKRGMLSLFGSGSGVYGIFRATNLHLCSSAIPNIRTRHGFYQSKCHVVSTEDPTKTFELH